MWHGLTAIDITEQHTLDNPSSKPKCWRSPMQSVLHLSGELRYRGYAGARESDLAIGICSPGVDTSHTRRPAVWAGHGVGGKALCPPGSKGQPVPSL